MSVWPKGRVWETGKSERMKKGDENCRWSMRKETGWVNDHKNVNGDFSCEPIIGSRFKAKKILASTTEWK